MRRDHPLSTDHGRHTQGDITQTGMYQGTYSAADTWPAERRVAGTGKTFPSSITVYDMDAQGNTPPLRTISGPKTQLNWPTAVTVDSKRGEIFVANDTADLVTVYKITDNGDVAPTRILKGTKTMIKNPTGVAVDVNAGGSNTLARQIVEGARVHVEAMDGDGRVVVGA